MGSNPIGIIMRLKNLKSFNNNQIFKSIKNNSLRGKRHKLKLPVRGQRTSTNANTAKKLNHKI